MDGLIEAIANVGFPIAITLYLLMRIEGKLEKLSMTIDNLSNVLKNS
ncbi:MAG: YvrJ family protein [Sarcina sp.]